MRLLAFALAVITTFASFGINRADSVNVYFRVGHRQFDPSFGNNRLEMDSFIAKVREVTNVGDIESIVVRAYASPDGVSTTNERLARYRCESIADYIVTHADVNSSLIKQIPGGVGWDELRRLVVENPDVPSREEVLRILDNTPVWIYNSAGKIVNGRKKQLMELNGGRPYNWMLANLFPLVRNGVGVILYLKDKTEDKTDIIDNSEDNSLSSDSSDLLETTQPSDSLYVSVSTAEVAEKVTEYEYRRHHFALKTNILYDAVLMPNLEFEWLINKHWSVSLEGDVAWWKPKENKVYRMAIVSPEARYHINPRGLWHGMYVGAFVGGGLYQLENGGDGYRGEGGMGGLSFGYMLPLGKYFFMEAAIGGGYMHTKYKVYEPRDGHRLYMRTKSLNYFGPLKLKLSIAWRFDIVKKTVKVNSTL